MERRIDERLKLCYGFLDAAAGKEMIEICRASRADLPDILAIELAGFPSPWSEDMYASEFERDIAVFLLARDESGVVGYALGWAVGGEGHILKLASRDDRRRDGVGSRLLAALADEFRLRGVSVAWLEVRESNAAARSFYDSRGYTVIGVRRGYYSDTGEDAVVMFKQLVE